MSPFRRLVRRAETAEEASSPERCAQLVDVLLALDTSDTLPDNPIMTVSPVPADGAVVVGRDKVGRALRISTHPEHSRIVLSLWDGNRCIGTLRLAPQDVPDVVRALTAAVDQDGDAATLTTHSPIYAAEA